MQSGDQDNETGRRAWQRLGRALLWHRQHAWCHDDKGLARHEQAISGWIPWGGAEGEKGMASEWRLLEHGRPTKRRRTRET
jgi:hypothetical protein